LVEGLRGNQSITRLTLGGHFQPSAATAFTNYMQSRNRSIISLKLRLVPLCRSDGVCDSDELVTDLLKGPHSSGLQSLELKPVYVAGVWTSLVVDTPKCSLLSLKLNVMDLKKVDCLKWLPELLYLQELELHGRFTADECMAFCNAAKKNSSLHKVSVALCYGGAVSFEDWDVNVIRALKAKSPFTAATPESSTCRWLIP
jgi:hypothetical protein